MRTRLKLPIIHHHDYVCALPARHRFNMKKFHGVFRHLRVDGLISAKQVYQPQELSKATAQLVHTSEYVEKFFSGTTSEDEQRRTGFKWHPGLLRRCRLEAGGSILGTRLALQHGLACSTGGGTHHAYPDAGSGYCLLNDLAIAARYTLNKHLATQVLIVDLDVHQGDGTAFIFKDDDHVFTFSMHGAKNFPFRKQQSDLDISLDDNTSDEEYMQLLTSHLAAILDSFRPDLLLYNAGVDPHKEDSLGRIALSDEGLLRRDYYVINEAVSRGIPCFTVIGGGYMKDVDKLSLRHTIVHRAAIKIWEEKTL